MRTSARLPSLLALRAFEAVGRLTSFRKAGEELLITQSAVSHHIKRLEADLGLQLFSRGGRTIAPTAEGAAYLATVQGAFGAIAEATMKLKAPQDVRVSLLPSFAANWFAPRLGRLQAELPNANIVLDPTLRVVDLDAYEADLAIRFGDGRWTDGECRLLFPEVLSPVVSPKLLEARPIGEAKDLLLHTLLQTHRPLDWSVWAAKSEVDLSTAKTLQLVDYNVVLQAAIDGQGVALGRMTLISERIKSGSLVQPLSMSVSHRDAGHWLVRPRNRTLSPAARSFCAWLESNCCKHLELDSELS